MKDIILIFDVETSGLYHHRKSIEEQPHVLQFSYILFDTVRHQIVKSVNSYVNVDESVAITEETVKINGCTRELCNEGEPIHRLLTNFYFDFHLCETVYAHNYDFDSKMLRLEYQRNWTYLQNITPFALQMFDNEYMAQIGIVSHCTMKTNTQMVKAPHKNPKPDDEEKKNYKWPSLAELHNYCFGYFPEERFVMHNSIVDVLITLRCLMHYKYNYTIADQQMHSIIKQYS